MKLKLETESELEIEPKYRKRFKWKCKWRENIYDEILKKSFKYQNPSSLRKFLFQADKSKNVKIKYMIIN